MINQNH